MVVVQLAMGQFSPRIVQTILQDKPSQIAIGLFVGDVRPRDAGDARGQLRRTRDGARARDRGRLSCWCSLSIVVLVIYVAPHRPVAAGLVADRAGRGRHAATARRAATPTPEPPAERPTGDDRRAALGRGLPHRRAALVAAAQRRRTACSSCVPALGDVRAGRVPRCCAVDGPRDALSTPDARRGAIVLGLERTLDQDVAYGMRMLVDIAERSLADRRSSTRRRPCRRSTGCTTACASSRRGPSRAATPRRGRRAAGDRAANDWDGYVRLAFDEIRLAGAASPQVARRLREALGGPDAIAPPERRAALEEQLALLEQVRDAQLRGSA